MDKLAAKVPAAVAWAGVAAGAAVCLLPPPEGAPPDMTRTAGVVIVAVSLWATAALPEYFAAVIFFLLAMALTDAGAAVVFSGFHSDAAWMVFGGLVLGAAVQETGLGKALASVLIRVVPRGYSGLLAGAAMTGAALCFLIPSNTGRILILLPVFLALADRVGFAPGRPGRCGLVCAAAAGSVYPSLAVLPAAVPNLGWLGAVESIYGIDVTYGRYLVANFPVLGLVSLAIIPLLVRRLFPDAADGGGGADAPVASAERTRLAAMLAAALGLWMTDFAHGVSPAWIALGAAIACMLPRAGVVPASVMVERVSYAPWFFVAGVIGMGALVADAGLGRHLSGVLFGAAPLVPGADFRNFLIVAAAGMATGLAATVPGQPAIMTALASDIAAATGWPLETVLLAQPLSWAMAPFAYQFPPWILAAHLAGIPARKVAPLLLAMAAAAWLAMAPLQFLWWRALGYFG